MAITFGDMPTAGGIARGDVLAGRKLGRPVDGDAVVVPQHVKAPEAKLPGQTDRFVIDAFHQAAIARDYPGLVIDQVVTEHGIQVTLGHRHADCHRQPLPQWAGGAFDAGKLEILRMTRTRAAKFAEIADVVDRRARIAAQVQQAVDQHRSMPRRQHETVAVGPIRVGGIVFQELGPQHGRDIGHAHRHAGVTGIGGLHRVHRQRADGVGEIGLGNGHVSPRKLLGAATAAIAAPRIAGAQPLGRRPAFVNR